MKSNNIIIFILSFFVFFLIHGFTFSSIRFDTGVEVNGVAHFIIERFSVYVWTFLKTGWYIVLIFFLSIYIYRGLHYLIKSLPGFLFSIVVVEILVSPSDMTYRFIIWDIFGVFLSLLFVLFIGLINFIFNKFYLWGK